MNASQACDVLERLAPEERGSDLPVGGQDVRVLDIPLDHPEYVRSQFIDISRRHHTLLERIPAVQDVQSAWTLLLHCASFRANYLLRVVRPDIVRSFTERHDRGLRQCLARILDLSSERDIIIQEVGSLP